ncbi:hypothetical protein COEREDRAFT_81149 [Coemansia reversa NRRL 1564]|uniref:Uncharacterized protein n=1 Tax=Coemansia reversa (strain ATCC 12441 / NRRL 1564) TaxID=763665 RepID=A0A2G5BBT2_COERN|nr:hypothetical protein COEREDRAFT_81149 [Coemansia reversa NRRL 1564]|eukprot:PIA16473.1 hypothetical protein COEREDRAFT_81149 [Coemansia reversa NRRL 1564]
MKVRYYNENETRYAEYIYIGSKVRTIGELFGLVEEVLQRYLHIGIDWILRNGTTDPREALKNPSALPNENTVIAFRIQNVPRNAVHILLVNANFQYNKSTGSLETDRLENDNALYTIVEDPTKE